MMVDAMAAKGKETLTENLGVRVTAADLKRIDALVRAIPIATRHSIARAALRIGLASIERDPEVLVGKPALPPKR